MLVYLSKHASVFTGRPLDWSNGCRRPVLTSLRGETAKRASIGAAPWLLRRAFVTCVIALVISGPFCAACFY